MYILRIIIIYFYVRSYLKLSKYEKLKYQVPPKNFFNPTIVYVTKKIYMFIDFSLKVCHKVLLHHLVSVTHNREPSIQELRKVLSAKSKKCSKKYGMLPQMSLTEQREYASLERAKVAHYKWQTMSQHLSVQHNQTLNLSLISLSS